MEQVSLKSLIFNSYDDHAELVVDFKKASLTYSSTYLIDVLSINRLLNLIQKNDIEIDLYEYIQTTDYFDFKEFNLNLESIKNCLVNKDEIDFMVVNSMKKQIRA